jgi:hypothetical protein
MTDQYALVSIREGNMHEFGVCSQTEGCALSYSSRELTLLLDILRTIELRRHEGQEFRALLPQLDRFLHFFQEGHFCSHCESRLIKMSQPTVGLAADSEDYKRAVRANLVMDALSDLQALEKLPL